MGRNSDGGSAIAIVGTAQVVPNVIGTSVEPWPLPASSSNRSVEVGGGAAKGEIDD